MRKSLVHLIARKRFYGMNWRYFLSMDFGDEFGSSGFCRCCWCRNMLVLLSGAQEVPY